MKKLYRYSLLLLLMLSYNLLNAQQVTYIEAISIAKNLYKYDKAVNSEISIRNVSVLDIEGDTLIYEVDFEEGGFVLVSGHKSCDPVLAFSFPDENNSYYEILNHYNELPDALRYFVDLYKSQNLYNFNNAVDQRYHILWDSLHSSNYSRSTSIKKKGPLLTTKWGQTESNDGYGHAYNFGIIGLDTTCSNCPAGCVPVAMAQIINYWKHPINNPNWCEQYDWNDMPDELIRRDNPFYEIQRNAISKLIRDCGSAVSVRYCPPSSNNRCQSGAYSNRVPFALHQFGFNDAIYQSKSDYSQEDWESLIIEDLNDEHPLLYRGVDNDRESSHSFVCDGYKKIFSSYKFHFNWGWRGEGNGWFTLGDLNPETNSAQYDFSSEQAAVFNIVPSNCWDNISLSCDNSFPQFFGHLFLTKGTFENNHHIFSVYDNAVVQIQAGKEIILTNGFYADQGSSVLANIAPCGTGNFRNYIVEDNDMEGSGYENNIDSKECLNNEKIILYPNPTTCQLNIQLSDSQDIISKVEITNILGNKVLQSEMTNSQLDVSSLQNGIYILKVTTKRGKMLNAKFVKQ